MKVSDHQLATLKQNSTVDVIGLPKQTNQPICRNQTFGEPEIYLDYTKQNPSGL